MCSYPNAWAEEQVRDVTSSVQGSRKAPLTQQAAQELHSTSGGSCLEDSRPFCLLRAQRQMLLSHCAAPRQHRPQQWHACTCCTYLVPFFPPFFFKPTTKTRSLFSKQWIESVKAHFLQGNTSAITNSSSWKPPCLSFSVQKGLHKSAALH